MSLKLAAFALAVLVGCQQSGGEDVKLETTQDKLSYSIGINVGMNLLNDSIKVNPDAFIRGVMDAQADSANRLMTEAGMDSAITAFQDELRKKQMALAAKEGEANLAAGKAYLSNNATLPGVVQLPSGLQYKVVTEGKGQRPSASSTVEVHYAGRLIDGTEFDSSHKRGQPVVFPLERVMKGWSEALQLMPVGSKWELCIPSELAYGPAGYGGVIPPNATLLFEVELLSIK